MRLGALVAIFGEVATRFEKRRLQRSQDRQQQAATKEPEAERGETRRKKPASER